MSTGPSSAGIDPVADAPGAGAHGAGAHGAAARDQSAARPATSAATLHAVAFVDAHLRRAERLGRSLAEAVPDPEEFARRLADTLAELADPAYLAGQRRVAPGIGALHGVRSPLLRAVARGFRASTRRDRASALLFVADRLLHEPQLEARWFAFGLLRRTIDADPERSWQIIRRAAREARDWITVDTLAYVVGHGILREAYRWAELEQLTLSPSRWERRLVGSTIATLPFEDRGAGRQPEIAERGLPLLGELIGDAVPDVQKALSWGYRSMTLVDPPATAAALTAETDVAARTRDGHRAWVIRDALAKLDPGTATAIRRRLGGIRRSPGGPSTSRAAAVSARFAAMGLGRSMPEPPLT